MASPVALNNDRNRVNVSWAMKINEFADRDVEPRNAAELGEPEERPIRQALRCDLFSLPVSFIQG